MNTLLGKFHTTGVTLFDHTVHVVDASEAMFGTRPLPSRLGHEWLRFFNLDSTADWPRFAEALLAACLLHDWGKANADMQQVLRTGRGDQRFYHEHLSVLLIAYPGVAGWLRQRTDIDWDVVLAAVGCHHLRFGHVEFAPDVPPETQPVRMWLDHPEFRDKLVPLTADRLGISGRPEFPTPLYWGTTDDPAVFDLTGLREELKGGLLRRKHADGGKLLNAVRAALIAADAAGSGLAREGYSVLEWIRERFADTPPCDGPYIQRLIGQRVEQLKQACKWAGWNSFQDESERLGRRALLLAPCGSGKTLAAWRWIAAQLDRRPAQRVLFLYPTRATATEGFKDYVSWAPGDEAGLLHGTAGFDLAGMFPADNPDPRRFKRFDGTDPRLFALQHWGKRVFAATVDQFLAFLSYGYGPVCLLPLLADSVIVIDEVHSFDRKMFSALLGFLKAFDVPVLCMTATLPEPRVKQLVDAGLELSNPKPDDLKAIADAPRYRVARVAESEVIGKIRAAVTDREGKRVLWVVNQVSRAQQAVKQLRAAGLTPLCYHSRFKLTDRVARHADVMATIKAGQPAGVAVTTQVCEMSLDIDADLLVTEECPITSLVQRMGRCRRGRDELAAKGPGDVLVYKPAEERVYKAADLSGLAGFLDFVTALPAVGQSDLETGLTRYGPTATEAPKLNSFLASGAYAVADPDADSFRDIEAHNRQAVLAGDVAAFDAAAKRDQPGYVVPVPKKIETTTDSRLPRWLHVAPDAHYDPATGFWDEPLTGGD